MSLQAAQLTFVAESRELLQGMEGALLRLERSPRDAEATAEAFRAAHTIKGSAGVFGFDDIVDFAHAMEGVLEAVRAGRLAIDEAVVALLLACGDHLSGLLQALPSEEPQEAFAASRDAGSALIRQLEAALAGGGEGADRGNWHISARFGPDVLRDGLDPLAVLRYLDTLGRVVAVHALFDAMPPADEMDPQSCYVGLEIAFAGDVDKQAIEEAFEYVRDDCALRILPPDSKVEDFLALIEALPEDNTRLGELLVASGALTRHELEAALLAQRRLDECSGAGDAGHARALGGILVDQGAVSAELVDAALGRQAALPARGGGDGAFLRVRADKLDDLITLVGELVIAGAGASLRARRLGDAEMLEATSALGQLVEDVRDRALKLRMVPIGETFSRFHRAVRDLGRELGKEVELVLSGSETELDKSMIEKINDPLMHLVRNALDHGIEAPDVRERLGKPRRGRLQLNAYHESGSVVIQVADDGAGLDHAKIARRAIERGLAAPDHALTDADLARLIMEPGLSTADEVSSVSGRGVGMDVVRRNVDALRGTIAVDSVQAEGTVVSIRVPLTLAIIDGFLVGVGRASYVIPLEMVVECLELSAADRAGLAGSGYVNLRGEVLPLLRLRDVFAVEGSAGRRENVVVVNYGGQQAGFVVDALLGEFQTVIKPLGRLFERLVGIGGSTILGTGEVALILDVPSLVQRAIASEARRQGTGAAPRATQLALE